MLLTLLVISVYSQRDTLIKNNVYESLYSYRYGQPLYVKYKLYKGGGDCNRKIEGFFFKGDSIVPNLSADGDDYENSGYDKGHMVNAEDFAFDCKKEELTFRYYNSVPQTPKLNRGIWKVYETKIRELSQCDSLLIFCGGIFTKTSKPIKEGSKLIVPTYCYKVIVSLSTHKLIAAEIFTNTTDPKQTSVQLLDIEAKVKFFFEPKMGFSLK